MRIKLPTITMPAMAKSKRQAKKAEEKLAAKKPPVVVNKREGESNLIEDEKLVQRLEHDLDLNAKARAVTGVLGVSPKSIWTPGWRWSVRTVPVGCCSLVPWATE